MAFLSVLVIAFCPTTVSKVWGLYFLAETTKSDMNTKLAKLSQTIQNAKFKIQKSLNNQLVWFSSLPKSRMRFSRILEY